MNFSRLVLLAVLSIHFAPPGAAGEELPKIPVVRTWGDLEKAEAWVDADPGGQTSLAAGAKRPESIGTFSLRLGIDRSKSSLNDAAVLYCLVETDRHLAAFPSGPDALGPLMIRIEGMPENARAIHCLATPAKDPKRKRVYIQAVPFLKPGKHRLIVSFPVEGQADLDVAEATVEVAETAAPAWVPWGPYSKAFAGYGPASSVIRHDVISYPVALPASGAAALPVAPGGEEFPVAEWPAPATPLPKLIPTEPTLEVLPIVDAVMVKLPEKITVTPSPDHFLVRWWLNGKEQPKLEAPPEPRQYNAGRATKPTDIAGFTFELPAGAREGDAVAFQLLFCPRGYFFPGAETLANLPTALAAWPTVSGLTPVVEYTMSGGRLVPKAFGPDNPSFREIADLFVPKSAEVELRTDRKEYFLGENVQVHFVLKNKGADAFTYETGGDYRGASRYLRFQVTAKDAAGALLEDPDPTPMCMGGISSTPDLKPGKEWLQSLPITRYRRFEKAGTHTISASHDFGWVEATRARPVGETTISFVMPDAAQAEKVVEDMKLLPDNPSWSYGEARPAYADFICLRYPIYLAPLSRLGWNGDKRALQGLGAMETPEATWEIIRLMDHHDPALATEAALTLNSRLPDPEWSGKLGARSPFRDGREELRKRLTAAAWDAKFAPDVLVRARRLLASSDPNAVAAAGFMIQALGEPQDLAPVLEALDRQMATMKNRTGPEGNVLYSPGTRELLRAAKVLTQQGDPPARPTSLAREMVWLEVLPVKAADRPAGWEDVLLPLLSSASPLVREKAVSLLPSPLPPAFRPGLVAAFSDPDVGVQRAACDWVAQSKDTSFLAAVLKTLKDARHDWLQRSAANAAQVLGAHRSVIEAHIARIEDKAEVTDALASLAALTIANYRGGASGDAHRTPQELRAIKAAWQNFLDKHGSEIDAGKKFPIGSPELSPALFGKALRLHFDDGTTFPPATPK